MHLRVVWVNDLPEGVDWFVTEATTGDRVAYVRSSTPRAARQLPMALRLLNATSAASAAAS